MASQSSKDYPRHSVRLPGEYTDKIAHLQKLHQCNKSVIFRMGLDALMREHQVIAVETAGFSGDEETVEMKWKVVEALRCGKGMVMSAREAGTTRKTVYSWLADDPLFAEFAQDAKDESIELVEHVVWHKGKEEQNLNACYGILNAKHAQYGMVKAGFVEAKIRKFLKEKVLPLVERYIPRDQAGKFAGELRQLAP